jgi:hypothetical protein
MNAITTTVPRSIIGLNGASNLMFFFDAGLIRLIKAVLLTPLFFEIEIFVQQKSAKNWKSESQGMGQLLHVGF